MTRRIEPIAGDAAGSLAGPLSELHALCFLDDPWPPEAIAEVIGISGFFGEIAFVDGAAAGLALAQGLGEDCELLTLGVAPRHRRTGLGTTLLAAVVAEARHRSARRLFLEVAADNIAARALYLSHGFVQIGLRRHYYRRRLESVDALVLRLLLSS